MNTTLKRSLRFAATVAAMLGLGGCASLQAGRTAAVDAAVVSHSKNLQMTAQDYRDAVAFQPPEMMRPYLDDKDRVRDLVLDIHSDAVLANEAEASGLDRDPAIASRLAEARRKILSTALMTQVRDSVQVPEELGTLTQERYLRDKSNLRTLEARKIAHILLTKLPGCACDTRSLGERVRDLQKQLKDGADFAELARKLSGDGGSAAGGGELPDPVRRDGKTVESFETAVFALKNPGDVSEPLMTQYGVHLIKLLSIEPGRQLSYEEVEDKVRAQIVSELRFSAMERKRGEAYPDPTDINYDAMNALIRDIVQPAAGQERPTEAGTAPTEPAKAVAPGANGG